MRSLGILRSVEW